MSTSPTSPDASEFDFPPHWTQAARDAFLVVMEARPALAGAEYAALVECANLMTTAERLDDVARAGNYMSTGSTGQPVLHPAVGASTQARTAAAAILARLSVGAAPGLTQSTTSARAQKAAAARWARR